MKLDENERSTQIRLMKVKDMVLEDAHKYSQRRLGKCKILMRKASCRRRRGSRIRNIGSCHEQRTCS